MLGNGHPRGQQRQEERKAAQEEAHELNTASDKVNDLKFVAGVDDGSGPLGAGDDISVVFYGDAVALQPEGSDKVCQRRGGGEFRELTRLPVDDDLHMLNLSADAASKIPQSLSRRFRFT
jgi:hypothetical protein